MNRENLLNLIPQEPPGEREKLTYTSQFKSTVKDEYTKNKHAHRTMGEVDLRVGDPQSFLRKKTDEEKVKERRDMLNLERAEAAALAAEAETKGNKKPTVPRHDERPAAMGIKTSKNFVSQNAVDSIMAVSKRPEKFNVDTRTGDKFRVEPSGLDAVYVKKKDYGKTPEYIVERKVELQKMQEEYNAYVSEMRQRGQMYRLSEEDIGELLGGLKHNWEGLYKTYQTLSVITDSVPKKNRKEYLENEMKELEKDIDMLERYQVIYVAN